MILDTLPHANRYLGLNPRFAAAFAWLVANPDPADGRYAIEDQDLFVIIESGLTHDPLRRRFESHRRYIDIQVGLPRTGGEVMEWLPVSELTVEDDFQPDGDIAFFHTPKTAPTRLHVRAGEFAIFFPSDAHKPVCHPPTGAGSYRKAVFKVRV